MMNAEYLGQMSIGIAYLVVGAGLARLALRSKQRPERLLGIYFVLTGFDYFLYAAPLVFSLDALADAGAVVGRVCYAVAVGALVIFTREVFRSAEAWAVGLMWLCIAGVSVGILGAFAVGQAIGPTPSDFFFWPHYVGYTGDCLWVAIEAFLYHATA